MTRWGIEYRQQPVPTREVFVPVDSSRKNVERILRLWLEHCPQYEDPRIVKADDD